MIALVLSLLFSTVHSYGCGNSSNTDSNFSAVLATRAQAYRSVPVTTGGSVALNANNFYIRCVGGNLLKFQNVLYSTLFVDCPSGNANTNIYIPGAESPASTIQDISSILTCETPANYNDPTKYCRLNSHGAIWGMDTFTDGRPLHLAKTDSGKIHARQAAHCSNYEKIFYLHCNSAHQLEFGANPTGETQVLTDQDIEAYCTPAKVYCPTNKLPTTLQSANSEKEASSAKFDLSCEASLLKVDDNYFKKLELQCYSATNFVYFLGDAMHELSSASSCETLSNSCDATAISSSLDIVVKSAEQVFAADATLTFVCKDKKNISVGLKCMEGKWNYTRGKKHPAVDKICDDSALPMFGASVVSMMMVFFVGSMLL